MRLPWTLLLLLLALLGTAPAASAADPCVNPQSAADSLLANLQPDYWQPEAAAACLDVPPGRSGEATRLAIKLKKVLDARGLYVPVADLPSDPDYVDDLGRHRIEPLNTFDEVVLKKVGDKWMYDRDTVNRIDSLYKSTFSGLSQVFQSLLPEVFMRRVLGVELWQVLYLMLLVAVSFLAGRVAQMLLADQVLRFAKRHGVETTARLIKRTRAPLTWVATGLVFMWGIPDLQLSVRPAQFLMLLARVILAVAVVAAAVRLVDVAADLFESRAKGTESKVDDQVIPLLRRSLKFIIAAVAALVVIENMGVDVAGLVAGLGIGGLAFALAAQDTLENFFGSVVIFLDRPFQVGDWVVIDGSTEGVVEEVGFRTTRIRTFYNSVLSVPNGKVATAKIDNMGQRSVRRFKLTLGLTYDTPPDKIETYVERVRALLVADEAVWDQSMEVHFHSMGDSSLNILVYAFLDVPNWTEELEGRQRILLQFVSIAHELGISFAFPSQSVYVESMPPEVPEIFGASKS